MATDISTYPRPVGDTGVGFHFGANGEYPLGRIEHWQMWIDRARRMHGTWAKVLLMSTTKADPKEQAFLAIKALVDAGFEVIVRLFREDPNPGTLLPNQIAQLAVLRSLGVWYIEVNNEPNLKQEWQKDNFGDMAREVVGRNWVIDAKLVVAAGLYPGLPAMSPGGDLDDQWFAEGMLAEIKKTVTPSVMAKTWWALHNYAWNHPIDFPYDDVNVNGTPISEVEYSKYRWVDGMSRDAVNAERAKGKHPLTPGLLLEAGMSSGFGKYAMLLQLLDVPVISTEGGTVAGDPGHSPDKRYPMMDQAQAAIYNIEASRRMMWNEVSSHYFATCNWLLANRLMENPVEAGFETHAWWPVNGGMDGPGILSVAALMAMPHKVRPMAVAPISLLDNVTAGLQDALAKHLQTYPWGEKVAYQRGYKPIIAQIPARIGEDLWYGQPAQRQDGSLCLIIFQAGHYTVAETYEVELSIG